MYWCCCEKKFNFERFGVSRWWGGLGEIDILIGADLYWLLADGEVKKKYGSGLVGMTSNFSWFVSGPVSKVGSEGGFTRSCLSTTHVLCLQNFSEAEV